MSLFVSLSDKKRKWSKRVTLRCGSVDGKKTSKFYVDSTWKKSVTSWSWCHPELIYVAPSVFFVNLKLICGRYTFLWYWNHIYGENVWFQLFSKIVYGAFIKWIYIAQVRHHFQSLFEYVMSLEEAHFQLRVGIGKLDKVFLPTTNANSGLGPRVHSNQVGSSSQV